MRSGLVFVSDMNDQNIKLLFRNIEILFNKDTLHFQYSYHFFTELRLKLFINRIWTALKLIAHKKNQEL